MTGVSRPTVAKSGTLLLYSQVGLVAFNLVFTFILLRLFSKTEFAVLALLEILVSLYSLAGLGMVGVASQLAPAKLNSVEDRPEALALIKALLVYRGLATVFLGVLTILLAQAVSMLFMKTTSYQWVIYPVAVGAVGVTWFTMLQTVSTINRNFVQVAWWNLGSGFFRQVFPLIFYIIYGFTGYIYGMSTAILISGVCYSWPLRAYIFNKVAPSPFRKVFIYGIPYYLSSILRFGFQQFDQVLVGILLSPEILAAYNVARRFAKFVFTVGDSFQTPIGTQMATLRMETEVVQASFFRKATRYVSMLNVPLAALTMAASPWLMAVYGGQKYAQDWPLLAVLVAAQGAYAFYALYADAVFARLTPSFFLLIEAVTGGINYLFSPLLVLAVGQYGIAWGQILGFIVGVICAAWVLRRLPGYTFDYNGLRIVALPLLFACGFIILGEFLYYTLWSVPIFIGIGGSVFFIWTGRRLTGDDWWQIQHLAPSFTASWVTRFQGWLMKKSI